MDSHLVSVEIGIERGTYKRVKLDSLTFNKYGLESLNTKSVESRCTVQHNRMLCDNFLKHIPYSVLLSLYHLLCSLDVLADSLSLQLSHNERLEELDSHFLRKTALIYLKLGAYDDNRTS